MPQSVDRAILLKSHFGIEQHIKEHGTRPREVGWLKLKGNEMQEEDFYVKLAQVLEH